MPHPGTLSSQTREAFPKWQGLEQALIIPGFPSFPQACIRAAGALRCFLEAILSIPVAAMWSMFL